MKIFKVELDPVTWDDFNSCIIAANTESEVKNALMKETAKGSLFKIRDGQSISSITEIDLNSFKDPTVLLADYING